MVANEPFADDWGQSGFKLGGGRWPLGTLRFRLSSVSLSLGFALLILLFFIIHVNFTDFMLLKDVLSSSKTHICPRIAWSFGVNAMKVSERWPSFSFFIKVLSFIFNLQKLIISSFLFFLFKFIQDKQQKRKISFALCTNNFYDDDKTATATRYKKGCDDRLH